jgi:hypothetical protein
MVDPVSFAIGGTLLGACLLKWLQNHVDKPKELDYDNRWKNQEYIDMIHRTMVEEKEELGQVYTECECKQHTNPLPPVASKIVPTSQILANTPNETRAIRGWDSKEKKTMRIFGFEVEVPTYIPDGAKAKIRTDDSGSRFVFINLDWFTPDGKQMGYIASVDPTDPRHRRARERKAVRCAHCTTYNVFDGDGNPTSTFQEPCGNCSKLEANIARERENYLNMNARPNTLNTRYIDYDYDAALSELRPHRPLPISMSRLTPEQRRNVLKQYKTMRKGTLSTGPR